MALQVGTAAMELTVVGRDDATTNGVVPFSFWGSVGADTDVRKWGLVCLCRSPWFVD